MEKNNLKVLYIFNEGRLNRLNEKSHFPNDFFYFYDRFQKVSEVEIVEISEKNKVKIISFLIKKFEKILIKFLNLPFYAHKILSFQNISKIRNTDLIILTNETAGFSMMFLIKIFRNKKTLIFNMGIIQYFGKSFFKDMFIRYYINAFDTHIFLSNEELNLAAKHFPKQKDKFHYLPFTVDNNFWKSESDFSKRDHIIFIGNDLNRNFKKCIEIANSLKDYKFIFVTDKIEHNSIPDNVKLFRGNWREKSISDKELKNIYSKARISIVPTLQTIQPTGQSVILQSIHMGVPVMQSKVNNFWGKDYFEHEKSILLVEEENWIKDIKSYYFNQDLLMKIVKNSKELTKEHFNQDKIFQKLINLLSIKF